MHRIDTDGHAAGMFKEAPAPATRVDAAWCNALQEEVIGVLAAAGIAPVKGTNNQLAIAIAQLLSAKAALVHTHSYGQLSGVAAASHTHGASDIAGAFVGSYGTNGYLTLPGGLIMQWGQATVPPNSTTNIDLSIAFPTAFYAAVGSGVSGVGFDSQDNAPAVTAIVDLNTFTVFSADDDYAIFHFIALGK